MRPKHQTKGDKNGTDRHTEQKEDSRKFTIIKINGRGEFEAYFLRSGASEDKEIQWCSRCIWQFDTFDQALDLIKALDEQGFKAGGDIQIVPIERCIFCGDWYVAPALPTGEPFICDCRPCQKRKGLLRQKSALKLSKNGNKH